MLRGASFVGGQTTGPIAVPDGTVTAPAVAFAAQPSTGIYRPGSGMLGFVSLGSEPFRMVGSPTAVNRLTLYGAATGLAASLNTEGADAAISMQVAIKGSGAFYVVTGLGAAGAFASYAGSSVNSATIFGNATTFPVAVAASGPDTNIGVAIQPKAGGGLMAAVPDSTAAGGNQRGFYATDWQTNRSSATQVASGTYAVLGGGSNNTAGGANASVLGGDTNAATGTRASIGGGAVNQADATYGTIPGGFYGSTRGNYGKLAFASGRVAAVGDAQLGWHVLRRQTTDATVTRLTSDGAAPGAANSVPLVNFSTYTGTITVAAKMVGASEGASWVLDIGLIRGATAGSTAMYLGANASLAPTGSFGTNAATWRLTTAADTANGGLAISVTGQAATTINWVATISTAEVVTAS